MFDPSSIIVGLEIGTSKVCVIVGEVTSAGALNIVHTDELGVAALNISELLSQSANGGGSSAAAVSSSATLP